MAKIIYLTADYHDTPEIQPAWQDAFKNITGVEAQLKTVSSKDAHDSMVAMLMGGEKLDVIKYGTDDISPLARQEFIIPLDKFIETVILTNEGSMLLSRGIPGVSYKVVDNTFEDNFEESGTHMKTRPPLNPNIKFPYKLPPLMQRGAEMKAQFDEWFSENSAYAVAEEPSVSVPAFDMIHDDMKDKKNELFWKYVMGEHSFEEMMKQFDAYKKEVDFDSILAEINGKL